MKDSKFVIAAQSGGVAKGKPAMGSDSIGKGSWLKTAWANQTAKPSVMTNMSAAKMKVR
jgi:hypothetical protein